MIDWLATEENLREIRRALLKENVSMNTLPAFAITREDQRNLQSYFGLTYQLYNEISSGRFSWHGFDFALMDSTAEKGQT